MRIEQTPQPTYQNLRLGAGAGGFLQTAARREPDKKSEAQNENTPLSSVFTRVNGITAPLAAKEPGAINRAPAVSDIAIGITAPLAAKQPENAEPARKGPYAWIDVDAYIENEKTAFERDMYLQHGIRGDIVASIGGILHGGYAYVSFIVDSHNPMEKNYIYIKFDSGDYIVRETDLRGDDLRNFYENNKIQFQNLLNSLRADTAIEEILLKFEEFFDWVLKGLYTQN